MGKRKEREWDFLSDDLVLCFPEASVNQLCQVVRSATSSIKRVVDEELVVCQPDDHELADLAIGTREDLLRLCSELSRTVLHFNRVIVEHKWERTRRYLILDSEESD